jgi:dinuclear metal center YbgI/SA1388 family protein
METIAPSYLAEEWDNVGLQVGQNDWHVRKIWVALDPLTNVVSAACDKNVDMLITHHPLIFRPLPALDFNTTVGSIIHRAIQCQMAIFSAHTNLDSVADGTNDILAKRIGLNNIETLGDSIRKKHPHEAITYDVYPLLPCKGRQGLGRVGKLESPVGLTFLAETIKNALGIKSIKVAGRPDLPVRKAALCTGSGTGLLESFLLSDADVYISGDMRYHDARAVESANLGLIDIGHFASEYLMVEELAGRLQKIFSESGMDVAAEACQIETDPFYAL